MLPFLACPLGLALQALPRPDDRARGGLDRDDADRDVTHPLVGYENETVVWTRLLEQGRIPADDRSPRSASDS